MEDNAAVRKKSDMPGLGFELIGRTKNRGEARG